MSIKIVYGTAPNQAPTPPGIPEIEVVQGTTPWVVAGAVGVTGTVGLTGPVSVTGSVGVTQSTSPWVVGLTGPVVVSPNPLPIVPGSPASDAFGRLRTSESQTLLDVFFQYDAQPLLMQIGITGPTGATGATVTKGTGSYINLYSGNTGATGSGVDFQTKSYAHYEPGKSQLAVMTGILGAYKQYIRNQIGYFDKNDGVFFDMDGTSQGATGLPAVTIRSSVSGAAVETSVLSSSWNIDKMDGTGPSGLTINWAYPQQFVIDLEWLGVGIVRFGLRANSPLPFYCHEFSFANTSFQPPYMNTASLPLHWATHNTNAGATGSLTAVCGTVAAESGNQNPAALQFGIFNPANAPVTCTTAPTPVLSISPKTTFNGITNRSQINLQTLEVLSGGAQNCSWELRYNPTLTGASFQSVSGSSAVNYDVSATGATGGLIVASGFLIGGAKSDSIIIPPYASPRLPFTLDITGTIPDVFTILCTSATSTTAINASMSWIEIR